MPNTSTTSANASITPEIEFLRRAVPITEGAYTGIVWRQEGVSGRCSVAVTNIEQFLTTLEKLKTDPRVLDLQYGISTQSEPKTKNDKGEPLRPSRFGLPHANWSAHLAVEDKSFLFDIDCGPEKDYPDIETARQALQDFVAAAKVPTPTARVRTGHGLHVHWILDKAIPSNEWHRHALALQAAADALGLKVDRARTGSRTTLPRIPGTWNNKDGAAIPVIVESLEPQDCQLAELTEALQPWLGAEQPTTTTPRQALSQPAASLGPRPSIFTDEEVAAINAELSAGCRPDPLDIEEVADHCAWVKHSLDTRGVDNDNGLQRQIYCIAQQCENPRDTAWRLVCERQSVKDKKDTAYVDGQFDYDFDRAMRECGSNPKLSYIGCQKINSAQCKTCTHLSKGSNPLRIAQEEAGAARLAMLGQQTSNIIPLRPSTGAAFADPNAPAARAPATKNDSAAKPAKLTIIETRLRHSKHTFSYDLFSYENLVDGERLTDHHLRALRVEITKVGGINLGKDDTYDMIKFLCHEHRFNPVLDYLNKLEWDGVARVDTWLQTYAGAKNVPFTRAAGRKWLIAMVRRVRQPGCKFDYALIFEGPQRRGKSSAGKTLAGGPKYFSDNDIVALDANKQIELLSGKWVVELAEIDKLSRHEAGIVKSFMSRSHDKARLAWAKETEERARNCVFFGTCNKSEYLRDETGNMRYWPVAITGFDLPALERDRDQLLAEAAHLERSEASLELPPEVIPDALKAQEERRQRHDWEDVIEKLVGTGFTYKQKQIEFISNDSIFQHLGIDMKSRNGGAGSQLSGLMKLYGWTPSGKPVRIPGAQRVERGYFRRAP